MEDWQQVEVEEQEVISTSFPCGTLTSSRNCCTITIGAGGSGEVGPFAPGPTGGRGTSGAPSIILQ
jgi:hypothetical protein